MKQNPAGRFPNHQRITALGMKGDWQHQRGPSAMHAWRAAASQAFSSCAGAWTAGGLAENRANDTSLSQPDHESPPCVRLRCNAGHSSTAFSVLYSGPQRICGFVVVLFRRELDRLSVALDQQPGQQDPYSIAEAAPNMCILFFVFETGALTLASGAQCHMK